MINLLPFFTQLISLIQKLTALCSLERLKTLHIYVNDILIAGNNMKEIQVVKSSLNAAFAIKDVGQL